jgi:hypothetical protein
MAAAKSEIMHRFTHALDADDFAVARSCLATDCVYEIRGEVVHGADAIIESYAAASKKARHTFDSVRYESALEDLGDDRARVLYTDIITHGGREHRHRCQQELTARSDGLIVHIVHHDMAGELEALDAFMESCGIDGPLSRPL